MKQITLIVGLMLLLSDFAYGQPEWAAGVKIGMSMANAKGEGFDDYDSVKNIALLGVLTYPVGIGDWLALQTEHGFIAKGWKGPTNADSAENTYLDFSVLAKLAWPGARRFNPTFAIGPYVGGRWNTHREGVTADLDWGLASRLDLEISIGGTKKLLLSNPGWWGLNKVIDGEDAKLSSGAIMFGFQF